MNHSLRALLVVGVVAAGTVSIASDSSAQGSGPTLTAAQKQKLARIQAQFVPGAKDRYWSLGFDGIAKYCGASIPMTIDPSTVALEKVKESDPERTAIPGICQELADSVTYTCGNQDDADPVVKEMVRGGVKKIVCAAAKSEEELGGNSVKHTLDAQGTLTMTYGPSPSDVLNKGMRFMDVNVKKNGLSIGGQRLKTKMYADLKKVTVAKALKDECKLNVAYTVDDRLAEHYTKHTGTSAISSCTDAMSAIYNFCDPDHESPNKAVKTFLEKNLKQISCTYGETMSLDMKDGTLTVASSYGAPSLQWKGRTLTQGFVEYSMEWMKENLDASKATASSSSPGASSSSKKGRKARR